jgi:hypothetical protein
VNVPADWRLRFEESRDQNILISFAGFALFIVRMDIKHWAKKTNQEYLLWILPE